MLFESSSLLFVNMSTGRNNITLQTGSQKQVEAWVSENLSSLQRALALCITWKYTQL